MDSCRLVSSHFHLTVSSHGGSEKNFKIKLTSYIMYMIYEYRAKLLNIGR